MKVVRVTNRAATVRRLTCTARRRTVDGQIELMRRHRRPPRSLSMHCLAEHLLNAAAAAAEAASTRRLYLFSITTQLQ